jgi:hypothetical protein
MPTEAILSLEKPYEQQRQWRISGGAVTPLKHHGNTTSLAEWQSDMTWQLGSEHREYYAHLRWDDYKTTIQNVRTRRDRYDIVKDWAVRLAPMWPRLLHEVIADMREQARHYVKQHAYTRGQELVERLAHLAKHQREIKQGLTDNTLRWLLDIAEDALEELPNSDELVKNLDQRSPVAARRMLDLMRDEMRLGKHANSRNSREDDY